MPTPSILVPAPWAKREGLAFSLPVWNTVGVRTLALLLVGLASLSGCESVDLCDGASIAERLANAESGDVVRIGACTLPAGVVVPAGVTLEGVGSTVSAIDALPGNLVAIRVETQLNLTTVVRGLSVLGRCIAIEVGGSGNVVLDDVAIDVEDGRGVSVSGVASAEFRGLQVRGPISAENANDPEWIDGADDSIGISLSEVGMATFSDVQVDGMAWAGVVSDNSDLQAEGLSIRNTLGYGVILQSGNSGFTALEIADTYQGLRGAPSIAFAARDAIWSADGFTLERSERYGIVSQAGSVTIDDLTAQTGGDAALWVGGANTLQLGGENTIDDMRFAGAVVVDSQAVDIRNLAVSNIGLSTRNIGAGGLFAMLALGDGVHLIGDLAGATFENIEVTGAERVGLLLELGEGDAPTFTSVSVDAPDGALGAIAGRASAMPFELDISPEPTWDDGITRDAVSEAGDAMFADTLGVARTVSPAPLPL